MSVIRLLAALFTLAFAALLGLGVLLFTAIDSKPLVDRSETISTDAIDQARNLLLANDPRRLREGEERSALIPAALLDEGVNYVASQLLHGRGALALHEKSAEARLSLRLPGAPGYLNLRATVPAAAGEPRIAALSVGDVPIPAVLAEQALDLALTSLGYGQQWRMARAAVRELAFDPARGMVELRYAWNPALLDSARAAALDPADVERIRVAHTAFVGLLDQKQRGDERVPLAEVLPPLMSGNGQGREQRRAALLVLASSLAGGKLAAIIPEAATWPQPQRLTITLHGRHDSAQHFVISAALAAWAGEPVATAIGVYKELEDARRGSGFSFADLMADRAGTRFGELVTSNAKRLDEVLAGKPGDADLLPPLDGLPEFLPEAEFRRRFGGPGEPAYEKVAEEIERRLATLALYR